MQTLYICKHLIRVQREKKLMKQNLPRRADENRVVIGDRAWSSDWNIRAKYSKVKEKSENSSGTV